MENMEKRTIKKPTYEVVHSVKKIIKHDASATKGVELLSLMGISTHSNEVIFLTDLSANAPLGFLLETVSVDAIKAGDVEVNIMVRGRIAKSAAVLGVGIIWDAPVTGGAGISKLSLKDTLTKDQLLIMEDV